MPPNTNDTSDPIQSTNPAPSVEPTPNMPDPNAPVDDTVPPTVAPNDATSPVETSAPADDATPDSASPPPINENDIPANNRPTLDTINTSQPEAPTETNDQNSLETEIDNLPETAPIENPTPPAGIATEAKQPNDITSQAAGTEPTPTPPAFPENKDSKPEKKGFFAKFFKHK